MRAADLAPEGTLEKILALGQGLPSVPGRYFYRKLKSRLAERSVPLFERALKTLRPGDIAIDLGAHVGDVTRRLALTGANVHAFEPDPVAMGHLKANVGLLPNVTMHHAAAAGSDGTALLYRTQYNGSETGRASKANSIVRRDRKMNLTAGIEVPVVDFARFLCELPRPARLIKVDIEGAEWTLLRAVIARALDRFEVMFVETHERFDEALLPEARRLQQFAASLDRPYINLYWT